MLKNVVLFFLISLMSLAAFAATIVQKPLSEVRNQLVLNQTSLPQKLSILKSTKIYFQKAYVNFEHKVARYHLDPIGELNKIEGNLNNLSELEFHDAMLRVYNSFQDQHTNYFLPAGYSCVDLHLPLELAKFGKNGVVITGILSNYEKYSSDVSKLTPGDELLAIEGLTPQDYMKTRMPYLAASTPDAFFNQGVIDLYFRPLRWNIMPAQNFIAMKFKSDFGRQYSVRLPWIASINQECVNEGVLKPEPTLNVNSGSSKIDFIRHKLSLFKKQVKLKLRSLRLKGAGAINLSGLAKTKNENLFVKKIVIANSSYAYFKLNAFYDHEVEGDLNQEVESLLKNRFSDADALIIDLRNNSGGSIPVADRMAALFNPRSSPAMPFFTKANSGMSGLYRDINYSNSDWKGLVDRRQAEDEIAGPLAMSDVSGIEKVYLKKVVLLTSANCFSSCEIFTANLKDNAHVKIYGTDLSTFGGAANFFDDLVSLSFYFGMERPYGLDGRITIRVSRRLSDNSLIEDVGIRTDELLYESKDEVVDPSQSLVMAKILKDLSHD